MSNHLAGAFSPYLRHHADDPVAWYPWSDEAFARARELDLPVLLSCGYEACHWCHVMHRESFLDPDTAALLNERFVSVKVDRELRPDVDAVYMDYVAATTGAGGWPMTVFLTPDRIPLLGGTYFPKSGTGTLPSFTEVLLAVDGAYRDSAERDAIAGQALAFLRSRSTPRPATAIDRTTLDYAADSVVKYADPVNGGFGGAPKFPQLPLVEFLIAYQTHHPEIEVAFAIEHALLAMVRGGVFDQAGGGVFRYAVDAQWRTPHFEKMLPDQGLLLSALAGAAPLASSPEVRAEYARAARLTASFMRREMALPAGGFCASLSAEAEGVEGRTYMWTRDELATVLEPAEFELAVAHLGVGSADGREAVTLALTDPADVDAEALDAVLLRILSARQDRPQPDRDTKRLTAWNAIAARGLIDAGTAFGEADITTLGVDTTVGLTDWAVADDGVLREPDDPSVADVRLLEDAAHLVSALLSAAQSTGRRTLLERAADLHADTLDRFAVGAVLYATAEPNDLPVRPLEEGDGAMPSGSSTALQNAARLCELTGDREGCELARDALARWWAIVDFAPEQAGRALATAVDLLAMEAAD